MNHFSALSPVQGGHKTYVYVMRLIKIEFEHVVVVFVAWEDFAELS